jgi:tRNA pseudouridine55 synthase
MPNILNVYKPIGLTPLEVIEKLKKTNNELTNEKISYAGRLDPMAHGVILLLVGDESKNRDRYLALPKTYEFVVAFGLQTDTYDLLGYAKDIILKPVQEDVNLFVNTFVKSFIGKQLQTYPPYSSKPVAGKPLFWWAKNHKISEITIPQHQIEIYNFQHIATEMISLQEVEKKTENAINLVHGDFRQKEILERWKQVYTNQNNKGRNLQTASFRITCSSGTYVRELAHQMGQELMCGALTFDILRTSIGNYSIKDALTSFKGSSKLLYSPQVNF